MYLFSRSRHVSYASEREGIAAAVEAAGMVTSITGLEVSAWSTVASPDAGLIVWSVILESLADLDAANQKLAASQEFGDWLDAHDKLWDGRPRDYLAEIVHGGPDPDRPSNVVFASVGVCAVGNAAPAMAAGIELAEAVSKITGVPTSFGSAVTGPEGGVLWFGAVANLGELEQGRAALNADPSWIELVDRHGPLFQPGSELVLYQRLA